MLYAYPLQTRHYLCLGDLDRVRGAKSRLDLAVDTELEGGHRTDHDETGRQAREETDRAEVLGNLDETARGRLARESLGLVHLGKERVGGLRDGRSGETGDQTRAKVERRSLRVRELCLGLAIHVECVLEDNLHRGELGHVVRHLLEQNGAETGVEAANALLAGNAGEATNKTVSEGRLRDETDTCGFQRAQSNVSKELSESRGSQVHGHAVLLRRLHAKLLDDHLLEQFVTAELETTLEEVAHSRRAETGQKSTGTFRSDNLAEAAEHTLVVHGRLELNTRLDDVNRGHGTVRNTTAERASEGETRVQVDAGGACGLHWWLHVDGALDILDGVLDRILDRLNSRVDRVRDTREVLNVRHNDLEKHK